MSNEEEHRITEDAVDLTAIVLEGMAASLLTMGALGNFTAAKKGARPEVDTVLVAGKRERGRDLVGACVYTMGEVLEVPEDVAEMLTEVGVCLSSYILASLLSVTMREVAEGDWDLKGQPVELVISHTVLMEFSAMAAALLEERHPAVAVGLSTMNHDEVLGDDYAMATFEFNNRTGEARER